MACTSEVSVDEGSQTPQEAPDETPKAKTVAFKIDGMSWGVMCPPKVRSALAKGLGVSEDCIEVDFATKSASVALGDAAPDMDAVSKIMGETKFTAALAD